MNGARLHTERSWALAVLLTAGLWAGAAHATDPAPLAAGHTKFLGNVLTDQHDPLFAH